jgi:hypothetical protein
MITDYKRARKDAAFLVDWAKNHHRAVSAGRYLEALQVMNGHDAVNVFALALMTDGVLPQLPEHVLESKPVETGGVPETGA